jgi:G3E family GTPase
MVIQNIPTNVITGFLGVGKTTAILHLLKSKPKTERWAVLVNEFGEIGIDGAILKTTLDDQRGIFIKEVPGGCMCCAAGLPMQIALTMLLAKSKPDRLLIEPTGLGHPKEVLSTLHGSAFKEALDVQHTITLVDARKLEEPRYRENEIFQQQLDIADVVAANKIDLYVGTELLKLSSYLQERFPTHHKKVVQVTNGELSIDWLVGQPRFLPAHINHHGSGAHKNASPHKTNNANIESPFPKTGFVSRKNQGDGFFSQGWIFKPDIVFCKAKLHILLSGADVERVKAVFITDLGVFAYNKTDKVLRETNVDETTDSRIEVITANEEDLALFELELLRCRQ